MWGGANWRRHSMRRAGPEQTWLQSQRSPPCSTARVLRGAALKAPTPTHHVVCTQRTCEVIQVDHLHRPECLAVAGRRRLPVHAVGAPAPQLHALARQELRTGGWTAFGERCHACKQAAPLRVAVLAAWQESAQHPGQCCAGGGEHPWLPHVGGSLPMPLMRCHLFSSALHPQLTLK